MVTRGESAVSHIQNVSHRINCKLQLPKRNFGESGSSVCIPFQFASTSIGQRASTIVAFLFVSENAPGPPRAGRLPFNRIVLVSPPETRLFSIGTDIFLWHLPLSPSCPPPNESSHRPTGRNSQVATASFLKIIFGFSLGGCFFFFYCVPISMGRMWKLPESLENGQNGGGFVRPVEARHPDSRSVPRGTPRPNCKTRGKQGHDQRINRFRVAC